MTEEEIQTKVQEEELPTITIPEVEPKNIKQINHLKKARVKAAEVNKKLGDISREVLESAKEEVKKKKELVKSQGASEALKEQLKEQIKEEIKQEEEKLKRKKEKWDKRKLEIVESLKTLVINQTYNQVPIKNAYNS
jgi:hypothetical protein